MYVFWIVVLLTDLKNQIIFSTNVFFGSGAVFTKPNKRDIGGWDFFTFYLYSILFDKIGWPAFFYFT